jgi:TolB-like protein/DNA-binding winged helix-turn-helix (wHTH) protein
MPDATQAPPVRRFGPFEMNLQSGELRKNGMRLRLSGQPFQVLAILVDQLGEVVTREELHSKLWPADTFVDFDHGLNNAVARIREVLEDSSDSPRFVETVPRRGYRFIAPLATLGPSTVSPPQSESAVKPSREIPAASDAMLAASPARNSFASNKLLVAGLVVSTVLILGFALYRGSPARRANPPAIKSLAVLPLENLSNDPEQNYFADGMTEELTTQLAQVGSVKVISRTSVMRFKGTKTPLSQIARELNVDAIVEGSVARAGDRVRISAQLIDASSDGHLWAHSYERDLREILALQAEVASAIATEVNGKLTPQQRSRIADIRPTNPDAYVAYLKGRYFIDNQRSEDGAKKSLEYSLQAVRIDPDWALGYSGLANSYVSASLLGALPPKQAMPQAKLAARKALQLDPNIDLAHVALANALMMFDFDFAAAGGEYQRAIALSPGSSEAHRSYATYLANMGRSEEAISEIKLAHQLDPLSFWVTRDVGRILYECRRYDQALEPLRQAAEMNPNSTVVYNWLSWAYDKKGMFPESVQMDLKHLAVGGVSQPKLSDLRRTFEKSGYDAYLRKRLLLKGSAYDMAQINTRLGNGDEAFRWLNKSYEERSGWISKLIADPELDTIRSDPRFQELLRRAGLSP